MTAQVVGNRQTRAVEDFFVSTVLKYFLVAASSIREGANSLRATLLATVLGPLSDKSE